MAGSSALMQSLWLRALAVACLFKINIGISEDGSWKRDWPILKQPPPEG
jgi:hypothetical protein